MHSSVIEALPSLPHIKRRFGFRLGVPSYVYPADLIANVRNLAQAVDDIEVVLFESGDVSNLPDAGTIAELAELAGKWNLTYTIHLPIDRKLGAASKIERNAFADQAIRIFELTAPLNPQAWILHPDGIAKNEPPERRAQWVEDAGQTLERIAAAAPERGRLCLENLGFPFEWCEPWLDRFSLGVCIDFGHLWLSGADDTTHLARFLPRCRVIHFHGICKGRDHLSLDVLPENVFDRTMDALRSFSGVVTAEVFDFDMARTSLARLLSAANRNRRAS